MPSFYKALGDLGVVDFGLVPDWLLQEDLAKYSPSFH